MESGYIIDAGSKFLLHGRALVLDTNALIDALRFPIQFYDLTKELEKLECTLVTTRSILLEFFGGTTNQNYMDRKQKLIEVIFNQPVDKAYMPLDPGTPNLTEILAFSRQAKSFALADYELYRTIKKYGSKIALMTRNHKDFSASALHRISFVTLLGKSEIHTYGVYEYATKDPA